MLFAFKVEFSLCILQKEGNGTRIVLCVPVIHGDTELLVSGRTKLSRRNCTEVESFHHKDRTASITEE